MSSLRRFIPKEWTETLQRLWRFDPDPTNAYFYNARTKVDGSAAPGYRYPAPGSQPPVNVPHSEPHADKTYDIGYYHRDSRRAPIVIDVASNDPPPPLLAAEEAAAKIVAAASPGRPVPDATRYDPVGLRNTYTTTQAATQKAIASHFAVHLPRPHWGSEEVQMQAITKAKALGIPVGPGIRRAWKDPKTVRNTGW